MLVIFRQVGHPVIAQAHQVKSFNIHALNDIQNIDVDNVRFLLVLRVNEKRFGAHELNHAVLVQEF